MLNGYAFLNPSQARALRIQRVQDLEIQHYGALLMTEENPEDQIAQKEAAELERRIAYHMEILTAGDPGQPDKAPVESLETSPSELPK